MNIGFLQGPSGEQSSSRLVMATAVLFPLVVCGICSVMSGTMQDIPQGVLTLAGMAIAGKVGSGALVEKKA